MGEFVESGELRPGGAPIVCAPLTLQPLLLVHTCHNIRCLHAIQTAPRQIIPLFVAAHLIREILQHQEANTRMSKRPMARCNSRHGWTAARHWGGVQSSPDRIWFEAGDIELGLGEGQDNGV